MIYHLSASDGSNEYRASFTGPDNLIDFESDEHNQFISLLEEKHDIMFDEDSDDTGEGWFIIDHSEETKLDELVQAVMREISGKYLSGTSITFETIANDFL